jgi:hypothetical protein
MIAHLISGDRFYLAIQILEEVGNQIEAFCWALPSLGLGPPGFSGKGSGNFPRLGNAP